ncbi:MAG: PadR family transcriptional regulator [Bifidobacteriaceae bacterium]|jgi:PadR family transcriptional regulator PadR|nr:PadR family transcriptional regulator [Bifidobacteriaceae bacterium]
MDHASVLTPDLVRGNIDTMILKTLLQGDHYGYRIAKMIAAGSDGQYEPKEATLYSSLRRLEANGWVEPYWGDETQGGRRKYYKITAAGRHAHTASKAQWERAKSLLDTLL